MVAMADDGTLNGLAGKDCLYGNDGDDTLRGGAGDDARYGLNGRDRADGGAGDDDVSGDVGNDTLTGGAGRDDMSGARAMAGSRRVTARWTLNCGSGRDTVTADRKDRIHVNCERVTRK